MVDCAAFALCTLPALSLFLLSHFISTATAVTLTVLLLFIA